ncbi:MAG: S-layer homology domain-containing protein, partial [Bacillota bacterium]|nr:S-layer homology domain-containing protein [Bacillota bacterium]
MVGNSMGSGTISMGCVVTGLTAFLAEELTFDGIEGLDVTKDKPWVKMNPISEMYKSLEGSFGGNGEGGFGTQLVMEMCDLYNVLYNDRHVGWIECGVNKEKLMAQKTKASEILSNESAYTEETIKVLKEALEAVNGISDERLNAKIADYGEEYYALYDAVRYIKSTDAPSDDEVAASAVTKQIEALPTAEQLTLSHKAAVEQASKAYEALTEAQKSLIAKETVDKLSADQAKLQELISADAVNKVKEQINALPAVEELTLDNKEAVEAARASYDALSEEQKAQVGEEALKKLTDAEAKLVDLGKTDLPFTDVSEGQWFYPEVEYVYGKGIMMGMTDTQFGPNEDLTRGQFVTILGRYAGIKDSSKGSPADKTFNDVKETSYYASHVKWAVEQKITNGVSETKFAPEEKITREQMAAMMYRYAAAMKVALPEGDGSKFSDDGKISSYAKEAVYSMKAAGILGGMGNNTFAPKGNATRAQAARVIHMFMEYEPAETVVVSMEKFTLGQGYVIEPSVVELEGNDTAATVIERAAKAKGIEVDSNANDTYGYYLARVKDNDQSEAKIPQYILDEIAKEPNNQLKGRGEANWLGEFDYYNQSGWMFCLNNEFPNVGAGNVSVEDGDVIRWQFTVCGLGRDIGSSGVGGTGEAYIKVANKDALTTAVAKAKDKDSEAYKAAVEVLKKLDATQDEVDAACKAL